jgi:hypothetical protein
MAVMTRQRLIWGTPITSELRRPSLMSTSGLGRRQAFGVAKVWWMSDRDEPPAQQTHLTGPRVSLRPGTVHDVDRLASILREPDVAFRWGTFERRKIEEEFIGDEKVFVIEVDGEVIGAIQYGEEDDPMYRHASIDIFLTTTRQGQGFG